MISIFQQSYVILEKFCLKIFIQNRTMRSVIRQICLLYEFTTLCYYFLDLTPLLYVSLFLPFRSPWLLTIYMPVLPFASLVRHTRKPRSFCDSFSWRGFCIYSRLATRTKVVNLHVEVREINNKQYVCSYLMPQYRD